MKRPFEPAPPAPLIRPGGIRDRAMRAVEARGSRPEDPEKTRRSREYWAEYRARAKHESPQPSEKTEPVK